MAGADNGDVTLARVEWAQMNACIGVDENSLGDDVLCAEAGDGVTVVEVPDNLIFPSNRLRKRPKVTRASVGTRAGILSELS